MSTQAFRSLAAAKAASIHGHVVEIRGRRFTWYVDIDMVRYPKDFRGRALACLAEENGEFYCMTCRPERQRGIAFKKDSGKIVFSQGRLMGKHRCGIGKGAHSKSSLSMEPSIAVEEGRSKCAVALRRRRSSKRPIRSQPKIHTKVYVERAPRQTTFRFHRVPQILHAAAGLNRHRPGEDRSLLAVATRLRAALANTDFNGDPGSESLFIASPDDGEFRWDTFERSMRERSKPDAEIVQYVFGEVESANAFLRGEKFSIVGLKKAICIGPTVLQRTLKKFERAGYRINDPRDAKVLVMAEVWINSAGEIIAERLALYISSKDYVICESLFEVCMANWLAKHCIDFEKCLGTLEGSNFKSDFEIFGYALRVFLEVWGLKTPTYLLEMERKLVYYWGLLPLIQWHACLGLDLPDIFKAIEEALAEHALNLECGISGFWRDGVWRCRTGQTANTARR
jgi:hypothetical protein